MLYLQWIVKHSRIDNLEKLAPIHNLAAGRSVCFINFELLVGATFWRYGSLTKHDSKLSELKLQWSHKQKQVQAKSLEDRQIANISVERRKYRNFNSLKK